MKMVDEYKIKESFSKIKEDILYLKQEMIIFRHEFNAQLDEIKQIIQIIQSSTPSTQDRHPAHNPAHNLMNYPLESPNFHSSIGNEGVPADRQQTDNRQIMPLKRTFEKLPKIQEKLQEKTVYPREFSELSKISTIINDIKQDLGEKFKNLTQKEFLIFSVLYTLEEENPNVTYNDIAQRTGLTESSIRDYISKLIHKGLPIIKQKLNNKMVFLKIPKELKDIATLDKLSRLKGF